MQKTCISCSMVFNELANNYWLFFFIEFCTPFPKELSSFYDDEEPPLNSIEKVQMAMEEREKGVEPNPMIRKYLPATFTYNDYVHQGFLLVLQLTHLYLNLGTSLKDVRSRVVKATLNIEALQLNDRAKDKLRRLAHHHLSHDENVLTLVCDRLLTTFIWNNNIFYTWQIFLYIALVELLVQIIFIWKLYFMKYD